MAANAANREQSKIVAASKTNQNLSVAAGAGTGKTSTCQLVTEASPYRQFHYLAYNASTKEEAKRRFPRNVRVTTSHGLAYGAIGKEYAHRIPGPNVRKVMNRDAARLMGLPGHMRFEHCLMCERQPSEACRAENHPVTVEMFCYSAESTVQRSHAPRVQGIDERIMPQIRAWAARKAQEVWISDLTSTEGRLWYWPDLNLKEYQLKGGRIFARTIILDEAQDTNECVWDILVQQQGKQFILVGDSNQMIYEWRGAHDVMDELKGAMRLYLTGSYRFGPRVAEEANKWLALLGSEMRLKGYKRLDSIVVDEPQAEEPDAMIFRTNAGCIGGAFQGLSAGKQVAIVGGGHAIEQLAKAATDLMAGRPTDHPDLIGFDSWTAVQEYCKAEPEDAGTLVPLVTAVDDYGPGAILDMTRQLVPEARANLIVTTCHKAKGLEWNHIRIGNDFPTPAGSKPLSAEEKRLAYVAVTRGKHVVERGGLRYIDELV